MKRKIEDILFYRKEDQDMGYRPTIRIIGTRIFDEVSTSLYLYFYCEYTRKKYLYFKPSVEIEGEHTSLRIFDLESFRVRV